MKQLLGALAQDGANQDVLRDVEQALSGERTCTVTKEWTDDHDELLAGILKLLQDKDAAIPTVATLMGAASLAVGLKYDNRAVNFAHYPSTKIIHMNTGRGRSGRSFPSGRYFSATLMAALSRSCARPGGGSSSK
jgi:membrane-associated phospholipid phosphatase